MRCVVRIWHGQGNRRRRLTDRSATILLDDLLDVTFARFGSARSVVTAASVAVAIGAASVGVVTIARLVIVGLVVARLVVTGLRRIAGCVVIGGPIVIAAT